MAIYCKMAVYINIIISGIKPANKAPLMIKPTTKSVLVMNIILGLEYKKD